MQIYFSFCGEMMNEQYEVEVFIKDNKIIVMGKIRPIHLYFKELENE